MSDPLAVSAVLALGTGVVSFLAPCTVPLLPAYVGVLSGGANDTARLVRGSVLYVLGFATVFVALGLAAGSVGHEIRRAGGPVQRIGGAVVLLLAVLLLTDPWTHWLSRVDAGAGARLARAAQGTPFLLGVVFATAFTPCVGPFLGAVLVLAGSHGGVGSGALLLACYAVGLGLPFVVAALAIAAVPRAGRWLTRVAGPVSIVGGVALAALGVTLLLGQYGVIAGWLAQISPT
ncbi:MAG TPA: cytochrome c biogenesis protein CcdA [Mycobacteriales bacterium]|nr:cytochrome c biogenesis protein CcdA [Mycobacteriales bacterium]